MVGAQESHECAAGWRNLSGEVIDIFARAQQAETAARIVPFRVDVQQYCDDFAGGITMDVAVASAAAAAGGDSRRTTREIDAKLFLECLAELRGLECINELAKTRAELQRIKRKASGPLDVRIVGVQTAQRVGLNETR